MNDDDLNPHVEELLLCVRQSGLIPESLLSSWLASHKSLVGNGDPTQIAQALITDQLLTSWQASKLLKGKWQGFFLDQYLILSWHHKDEDAERTFYSAVCTKTGQRVLLECTPKLQGMRSDGSIRYKAIPADK